MDPTAEQAIQASTYVSWASVPAIALLALAVVGGALLTVRLVTRVVDRIHDSATRLTTYECGEAPVGSAWFRFNNRFTIVALTFLVFDVELALLWPILPLCLEWLQQGKGWVVAGEIAAFAGLLALGLAWVARGGGFIWDRTVEE